MSKADAPAEAVPAEETAEQTTDEKDEGELDEEGNHKLEYTWVLWFDSHQKSQNTSTYGQSRRKVYTFSTVEDFWRLYNNIKLPSEFPPGTDYLLFKQGIDPEWEDPSNGNGGSWTLNIDKNTRNLPDIDSLWMNASMAVVGEQFDESDEICGLFCSIRSGRFRMQLWTRNGENDDAMRSVGKQLKQHLKILESGKLVFTLHDQKDQRLTV